MLKAKVYSAKGVKMEDFSLPKEYDVKENLNLLAQASRVYESNSHAGSRKTKTRSEVQKSTRKIYKQKGTGGARHGAKSAPIFVGGGVAFGPTGEKRPLSLPSKIKALSKITAVAFKLRSGNGFVVSGLEKISKSKEASDLVKKAVKGGLGKKFTVALSDKGVGAYKAFRNLRNVSVFSFKNMNAWNILKMGTLVLDKRIFEVEKETSKVKVKAKTVKAKTKAK